MKRNLPFEDEGIKSDLEQSNTPLLKETEFSNQVFNEDLINEYKKLVNLNFLKIGILIVLIAGVLFSVIAFEFFNALIFVLFLVGFVLLNKKKSTFTYGVLENYYTSNLSTTLRGFFTNVFKVKPLFPFASTIGWIAIIILFVEQIMLRNFLHYTVTTSISGFGLLILLLSILLMISTHKMKELSVILATFAFFSISASLLTSVAFGYISGQNFFLAIVALAFAEWFNLFNIYKVDKEELKQAIDEKNKELSDNTSSETVESSNKEKTLEE